MNQQPPIAHPNEVKRNELIAFVEMAIQFAKKYLACGGPTSRLEKRLSQAGKNLGFPTDVFATPTGIFISSHKSSSEPVTIIGRIKDTSINLAQLYRLEKILTSISDGNISPSEASRQIRVASVGLEYSKSLVLLAGFLMGFGSSFPRYNNLTEALLSGLVTVLVMILTSSLSRFLSMSGVFYEFFGCLVALLLAGLSAYFFHYSGDAIAIGTLVYLVPGLTFTNAISELADHNFVSGTAKTMRGFLTLLAIGIAFFLFNDLSRLLKIDEQLLIHPSTPSANLSLIIIASCHLLMVLGFSVIFQCPRKAIPWALLTGLLSWYVLGRFNSMGSLMIASFLSSFVVGIVSLTLSRLMHMPSQIFSVPGILSLVPGLLSLGTLNPFFDGSKDTNLGMKVALIGSAIVFGLFSARVPFMLSSNKENQEVID